jgi:mediator of RNA polymerase II transcription subunit 10
VHRTASASLRPPPPNNPSDPTATSQQHHPTLPNIPDPLIAYVENGRNPDVYTREMVELVRRMNQLARGKETAFVRFRDVLAREMGTAMPELRADVERVVQATGGEVPIAPVVREAASGAQQQQQDAAGAGAPDGDGKK